MLLVVLISVSCKKHEVNRIEPFEFSAPSYFPQLQYDFSENQITKERFELGKMLFFDPVLSSDSTISCASCHAQVHAFADHNVSLSAGVEGRLGRRNSPSIANMAFSPAFMWDGGVNHLEIFSLAPITDTNEMNETMSNVIDKLNQNDIYKWLFQKNYDVDIVNDQVLFKALTNYMTMIVSDQSKYDQWKRGETQFSQEEEQGHLLFESKCASCHSGALQTDFSYRNNGLGASFQDDPGRGRITQNAEDYGKFKVPSLRNVMLTYPYMHDGRMFNIREVLDHYDNGVLASETLDPLLENGIPMTETEKDQIIVFLETLTDYELLDDQWLNQ
jgi:cytochrome c peroxidase